MITIPNVYFRTLLFSLICVFLCACAQKKAPDFSHPQISPINTEEPVVKTPNEQKTDQKKAETKELEKTVNLWSRIRSGFAISYQQNKRIDTQLKWYIKNPSYLKRVCERARPFLHDIVNVLEEKNIPLEIALLPIVESAFQPFAYSPGRAAGLWQFIPSTGKQLGLKQNWWYDGRRDAYASTRAAAEYLLQLNKMLSNNWLYSLAGYNAGPGNVRKAVRKNKKRGRPTDYWNLNLPNETKAYVPKLLALKRIVASPQKYGIKLCNIPDTPQLKLVKLEGQMDLAVAAELAEITIDELHLLNPGFNRWATSPSGPHHLLIPIEKAENFKQKEVALNTKARMRLKQHVVRSGDTLSQIAQKYNTTTKQIKRNNNLKSNRIRINQRLLIPTSSKSPASYSLSQSQQHLKKLNTSGKNKQIHTVKAGESWWSIAKKHSVNMKKLTKWNGKSHLDPLSIGQKIVIFNSQISSVSARKNGIIQKVRYPVRSGDSLYTIAQKFKVGINEIANWNRIDKKSYLQPGQQLVLYVDIRNQW